MKGYTGNALLQLFLARLARLAVLMDFEIEAIASVASETLRVSRRRDVIGKGVMPRTYAMPV